MTIVRFGRTRLIALGIAVAVVTILAGTHRHHQGPRMGRMAISGSAALLPSPRLSNGRPRANGTSDCSPPLCNANGTPYAQAGEPRRHQRSA
jgi:hypothetical protein